MQVLPATPWWLTALHVAAVATYLAAPVVMLLATRGQRRPTVQAVGVLVAGMFVGLGLNLAYAWFITGTPLAAGPWQVVLTGYLAAGLIAVLRGIDWGLTCTSNWASGRLTRRTGYYSTRSINAILRMGRLVVLLLAALPILASAAMTYRPKVSPVDRPSRPFVPMSVDAADGVTIRGWFLPARREPVARVLVVPGLGSGRGDALPLAETLRDARLDVLIIDSRAHGDSGGQVTSFGDRERLDVAAARRWLATQPREGELSTYGVGVSMGGAALLHAAADGASFDGLAVVDTYDSLPELADALIDRQFRFAAPVRWVTRAVAVPLLSVHAGRPLWRVKPIERVDDLWPTPLLVVHSTDDDVIPFDAGRRLFYAAEEPKRRAWLDGATHAGVVTAPETAAAILAFFRASEAWEPLASAEAATVSGASWPRRR